MPVKLYKLDDRWVIKPIGDTSFERPFLFGRGYEYDEVNDLFYQDDFSEIEIRDDVYVMQKFKQIKFNCELGKNQSLFLTIVQPLVGYQAIIKMRDTGDLSIYKVILIKEEDGVITQAIIENENKRLMLILVALKWKVVGSSKYTLENHTVDFTC